MNVNMKTASILLKKGYVVGFQTDTVYGLATLPKYEYKLFKLKNRNKHKKIVLMINEYLKTDNIKIMKLQKNYWPGKTTLIINNISYRYSSSTQVNELIGMVGSPLKVTSANLSGKPTVKSESEFNLTFKNIAFLSNGDFKSKNDTPSQILLYNNISKVIKLR